MTAVSMPRRTGRSMMTLFDQLRHAVSDTDRQHSESNMRSDASRSIGVSMSGLLQAVQEIRRALGMGGGGKNRALVVFQDLDPGRDIGGMILPNLGRQFKVGGEEGGAKLGDKL